MKTNLLKMLIRLANEMKVIDNKKYITLVVPVVVGVVPVDISQTAVIRVATVKSIAAVLKNCLFPSNITEN